MRQAGPPENSSPTWFLPVVIVVLVVLLLWAVGNAMAGPLTLAATCTTPAPAACVNWTVTLPDTPTSTVTVTFPAWDADQPAEGYLDVNGNHLPLFGTLGTAAHDLTRYTVSYETQQAWWHAGINPLTITWNTSQDRNNHEIFAPFTVAAQFPDAPPPPPTITVAYSKRGGTASRAPRHYLGESHADTGICYAFAADQAAGETVLAGSIHNQPTADIGRDARIAIPSAWAFHSTADSCDIAWACAVDEGARAPAMTRLQKILQACGP